MSSVHRGLRRWSQWHSCRRYSTILLKSKYCKAVKALCKLSGGWMLTSKCGNWFPSFNRKIKTGTCVFMSKACGCKPSKVIMWGNVIAIGWMKAQKWVDKGTEEFQQLQLWWGMPCGYSPSLITASTKLACLWPARYTGHTRDRVDMTVSLRGATCCRVTHWLAWWPLTVAAFMSEAWAFRDAWSTGHYQRYVTRNMSGTNTWQAEVGQSIVMICLVQSGRGIQREIEGDIVFLGNLKQPEGETWNKMQHI